MGQEVKNPLRAQSKYGLMGSSAKTGKKFFPGSPGHFLDKNDIWDRTPPHLHINCSLHVWESVQGSQIFKRNSIISIRSKVMAFLVISLSPWSPRCPHIVPVVPTSSLCCPHHPHIVPIAPKRSPCGLHGCGLRGLHCLHGLHPMLSPWSPCCPRCPHVVPVIPTSSPCCPCCPHVIPIAPRRSPYGLHGCGLRGLCGLRCLRGLHPMLSPWSPCCSCCPHIIPVIPTSSPSSPRHPHSLQKVPMWSPWLRSPWSPWSPWSPLYVVPMVSVSSPLSPRHPCVVPVVPTSSRRSPHHPLPPRYPLQPPPTPLGGWGAPNQ